MPVARLLPQQGDIAGNIPQYRIKSALDGGECTVQNREIDSWAWAYDRRKLTPKRGQRGLMNGVYPIDDVKIVAAGSLPGFLHRRSHSKFSSAGRREAPEAAPLPLHSISC